MFKRLIWYLVGGVANLATDTKLSIKCKFCIIWVVGFFKFAGDIVYPDTFNYFCSFKAY